MEFGLLGLGHWVGIGWLGFWLGGWVEDGWLRLRGLVVGRYRFDG